MSNCCLETKCIQCCRETNMILTYHDIENIEKKGYDRNYFITEHDGWFMLKNKNSRCVFHNGTLCTIYHERPEGCTLYPVVYDTDDACAILDDECPQQQCFPLTKPKESQLHALVRILEKERMQRRLEEKKNKK
jgi:Fe-S-cluster containining protein